MHLLLRAPLSALLVLAGVALLAGLTGVSAQVGPPPSTFVGTVNDEAGPVPEGLPVEAYIGNVECSDGEGTTGWWGEGADRVTLYVVDVWSEEQRPGCGRPGAPVRIKVGDSFVNESGAWSAAGLVRLDVSIGNVTPVPMPTVTPGPPATNTPVPATTAPGETAEPGSTAVAPGETVGPGTPTPTVRGGVTTNNPSGGGNSSGSGDGGMPVWLIVMLVLGGVAAVGGGVGMMIARANRGAEDDLFPPPPRTEA